MSDADIYDWMLRYIEKKYLHTICFFLAFARDFLKKVENKLDKTNFFYMMSVLYVFLKNIYTKNYILF
jgi:hypothetical protein